MALILEATVEMDDYGKYFLTVVDHLADTTDRSEVPEHLVGLLPVLMSEARRKLNDVGNRSG